MTGVDLVPEHSVAGSFAWCSTIHLPPPELERVLAGFHELLDSSGVLVVGFFDSDDGVAASLWLPTVFRGCFPELLSP